MERIGFVGLGTMGAAMAANLRRAGFESRPGTGRPAAPRSSIELGVDGGRDARPPSPGAADVVVVCVSDTPDVEAVLFGPDGVAEGARRGQPRHRLLDDLAVGAPATSPRASRERGVAMLDAPGLGRQRGRAEGDAHDLRGRRAGRRRARPPVLEAMGKTITHVGPIGAGQAVKAVNQVDPRRHLPRRRRGHRPRDQGRPRRRAGRRGARRRRGPELGPRQPQRPDDRQRLPARVQGRAPPQGPRHRPRPGARARGGAAGQRARRGARGRPDRPAATPTTTCPRSRARSGRSRASTS